jgi:hypothetical protein
MRIEHLTHEATQQKSHLQSNFAKLGLLPIAAGQQVMHQRPPGQNNIYQCPAWQQEMQQGTAGPQDMQPLPAGQIYTVRER